MAKNKPTPVSLINDSGLPEPTAVDEMRTNLKETKATKKDSEPQELKPADNPKPTKTEKTTKSLRASIEDKVAVKKEEKDIHKTVYIQPALYQKIEDAKKKKKIKSFNVLVNSLLEEYFSE